jgi:acyl-CoA hydrolase/RimJ/RimL family protein N-acetyltransferase
MDGFSKRASWNEKLTTAEEALSSIQSGNRIFVGTACATPRTLIRALESSGAYLADVQVHHFLTDGAILTEGAKTWTRFWHRVFFVGTDTREAIKQGKADYVPISISQVPRLIENGRLPIDVAMIQVSPPDEKGFVSLGVSVDITRAAVLHAKKVVAEVNPHMPRTRGETLAHLDQIHHLVQVDTPVIEYLHEPAEAVPQQIARYVARIIEDGSTLQIGLGQIPNVMLKYLTTRRDLGIHSDVITEPIVDLIEAGVITGRAKSIHKGEVVTSYCMGTRRLYDLVDDNPIFFFAPMEYVSDPALIAANSKMVSVTQAFAVDLTGQVCADQFGGEFYGGVSTQPDFLRGAASSPGGKAIVCLASTTRDGKESRIRPLLKEGEGVTIARSDIHYVVTEYGSTYLFGKSIRERALSLIEIAHPAFRLWLLEEAKRLGYVSEERSLRSSVAYPVEEEREVVLKNQVVALIRPSRASDVERLQELFCNLTESDVYTRFFAYLRSLSVSAAQQLCSVNYEDEMAFLAVVGKDEDERIIGSSCYVVDPSTNMAEVAYMIHPQWQEKGVGTALQQRMIEYARSKGLRGFTAAVLVENERMIKLIEKSGCSVSTVSGPRVSEITMLL